MRKKVPYYFKEFQCISSKCSDTCCAGWEIIIDEDTYNIYKNVKGEFGKRLNSQITLYEDNEPGFKLEGDNCPFLNKNKLCDIYSNLGEDSLCYTCKTYPRFIEEYGSLREIGLSLSCPEAARLILKDNKKVTFNESEDDEMVTSYNDISYDLYMQVISSREVVFNILESNDLTLEVKLSLIISFANEVQEKIDNYEFKEIKVIRKKYEDENFIDEYIKGLDKFKFKNKEKYENMLNIIDVYNQLEQINENWPKEMAHLSNILYDNNNEKALDVYKKYHNEFNEYYKDNEYKYKNMLVYFIYRYFMTSVYDEKLYSKVSLAIISYLIIKDLNIVRWIDNNYSFSEDDQIDIMHSYSKEIEHSEDNIYALDEVFSENTIFNINNMLTMILN